MIEIHEIAFDPVAPDRVGPVTHDDLDPGFVAGLQAVGQGVDVGVVTAADVLDVEDQDIQVFQVFPSRLQRRLVRAVQAGDRQTGIGSFLHS